MSCIRSNRPAGPNGMFFAPSALIRPHASEPRLQLYHTRHPGMCLVRAVVCALPLRRPAALHRTPHATTVRSTPLSSIDYPIRYTRIHNASLCASSRARRESAPIPSCDAGQRQKSQIQRPAARAEDVPPRAWSGLAVSRPAGRLLVSFPIRSWQHAHSQG